jgi:hypothetical protein
VFGVALPLLAYFASELVFSATRLDRAARVVARHGVSGRAAGFGFCLALGLALALGAVLMTVAALFSAYPTADSRLWSDLRLSVPIAVVAGAAYAGWYALASSFGRLGGGRKWFLGLDWILGSSTGSLSLLWPRGHVRNLLGGAPVAELSQSWSFGVLVVGTSLAALIGLVRSDD